MTLGYLLVAALAIGAAIKVARSMRRARAVIREVRDHPPISHVLRVGPPCNHWGCHEIAETEDHYCAEHALWVNSS